MAIACALAVSAWAHPTGPTVTSGQATVVASGKTLTITNTPGTVIHWQGFSIAPDELTRFIQQSARSSVLNRVVGPDPSSLLGQLQSNGRVFLINPNGIVFGAGARVDVGGLVASTLDLADADFLAGRLRAAGAPGAGALTQLGTITTPSGGQVLLIAPRIENSGVITTPQGEVLLAAGQRVQLADSTNPDLRVTVEAPAGEVLNLGRLIAEGGRIGIHAGLIRNAGAISSASRAEIGAGGEVILKASGSITLESASVIDAGGADGGRIAIDSGDGSLRAAGQVAATGRSGHGGSVHLLGRVVALEQAGVDASGAAAGGEILVGGAFQGADASIRNARGTAVDAATRLSADATGSGQGGRVVVWSDGQTDFAGSIAARGGAAGGDGGRVEVSGREALGFSGRVDTSAERGRTGTLLLDPSDITISTAADSAISAGPTYTGMAASSNLNVTTLQSALATNNVIVDTTSAFASAGNIAVNNAVTWASANSLQLRAHNNITVAAPITASGNGALGLIANQDGAGGGDATLNAALIAHGGGIAISGANVAGNVNGTLTTTGLANQDAGAVTIAATGAVNLVGAIVASGGAAGAGTAGRSGGNVTVGGTTVTTAAITASGSAANGALQTGGAAGTVSLTGTGALTTGAITASTGAAGTTGAGGLAGSITLQGTSVSSGALTTTGAANGAGGTIGATATSGLLNVTGAINSAGGTANASSPGSSAGNVVLSGASVATLGISANGTNGNGTDFGGGNGATVSVTGSTGAVSVGAINTAGGSGLAGNAAGGNAGAITLDAGGATPTITYAGSLAATGGNRTGTGPAGSGAPIWLKDAVLIGAGALTVAAGGGSAGVGAGGSVRFDGTVNSSGGARALTVNTNGATIFNGAVGAVSALASVITDATGTTQLNGGTVSTTGAQAFGDAVTLGAHTTFDAVAGAITFSSSVNGPFDLTANSGAVTTFSGAVGAVTPLASLTTNAGGSTSIGAGGITTSGNQTYNDAVSYSGATTLTATAGTVIAGSTFTASAPAGAITFTVDAGKDIALVNPANDFATVTITSARNVALRDANAIVLGASTVSGTLDVTAGGAISQSGALSVSGAASFTTGAAAVTLSHAGNDFMAPVSVINTGGNVAITDANDLQLGAIGMANAANTLTVVSSGPIAQAGATTITTGTGAVSFNSGAGGNPIALGNGNDFRGAVSLTAAGANDVAIRDINALTLGAGTVGRNLQANSAGAMAFNGVLSVAGDLQVDSGGSAVTQGAAGTLTVTGSTLLTAGAAGNITLNNVGNNFGGEVRIVSGNNVTLRDANGLTFGNGGASTVSGNLAVTSAGAITQTRPLNVGGTATFAPGAGNNVTLLDAANDFGGIAFTNGASATMNDANGVVFGTTSVTTLDINAGGTVSQSGVVSATTLTANLTGTASALYFNTSSNAVTNLAVSGGKGITAPGGFRLTNGATGINAQGLVTTTDAPIQVSTSGLFQNTGTSAFVAGTGDITVVSSQLAIDSTAAPGVFQTSGTLLMRPVTAAADMSFGGAIAAYNLIPVEVARVVGGVTGTVTWGEQGFSTGILTIAGALPFGNLTANLNAGSITDGGTVRTVTARNLNLSAATGTIGSAVANGAIDVAVSNLTIKTVNQNAWATSAAGYNLGFGTIATSTGTGTLSTNVSASGSITQTTKVTAGTLTATLASGALNLDTVDNNISAIGSITAPQGFRLANGNNPTTLTAGIVANGPVSISTGTGAFSQGNVDIAAGSGPITIIADAIAIAANTGSNAMQTTGTLTLKPFSAGTSMSLAGASAFDLSAAEVTDIAGGVGPAGAIVIGDAAASTGAMTLGGGANFGARTVTLNAGSFTDGNTVSPVSARDLNLNARTGAIGAAGAGNAIDVSATNLTFNTRDRDAFVRASGAVNLGGGPSATGSGNIELTAGGAITQSAGGTISSSGTTALAAGAANDVTLNAANDLGTVAITSARNVTLNDANGLDLGASTVSGNLQVTTAGVLTQSGALVANGAGRTATFAAGAGSDITLDGANDFTSVATSSARNVTLHDTNALALGASAVSGTFVATAGGNITLDGVVAAGGAGDAIVLAAAGNFVNNAGAAALVPGSGRWLLYSTAPGSDARGGLVYDFKQYDATHGVTPVLGAGNGMLYSLAPTLAVSLTGTVGKGYDATTLATLGAANYAFSGTIDADTATLGTPALGTYATKNVGTGINVSVAGVTVASAANAGRPVYGYQPASSTISANIGSIAPAALTVTAQAESRVYDSTTASTIAPLVTGALYDPVGTPATQRFDTKDVGVGKTLTPSGLVVNDGNGGSNYAISYVTRSTGAITPAALTLTGVTANGKVYDATATATLDTAGASLAGVIAGDAVTLATGASSATFADKQAGVAKPVTAVGFATSGADAANYTLFQPAGLVADIAPAALAVGGVSASNKVYDATPAATLVTTGARIAPLGADSVLLSVAGAAGTFADKNVGNGKAVSASGFTISGADAGNYTLLPPTGLSADIARATLAIRGVTASDKVYDATTAASLVATGASVVPFAGDSVTLSTSGASATFADKNVGAGKALSASGFAIAGPDAGNYILVQPAGLVADITPAALAVAGVSVSDKVYDASVAATLITAGARIAPRGADSVALDGAGASAAFADPNVGASKAVRVSGFTISGRDAVNYTLLQPVGLAADIAPRAISLAAGSNAPGSRLFGAATNPTVGYAVGGSGMAGGEDAQALFGFSVGSAAGPTTPVGVYATGGEQYRIHGLAPGIFGNYRIDAVGDGVLTISPAPARLLPKSPASLLDEPNRSLHGALERDHRSMLSPVPGSRCSGSGVEAAASGLFADPAALTADACSGALTVDMR